MAAPASGSPTPSAIGKYQSKIEDLEKKLDRAKAKDLQAGNYLIVVEVDKSSGTIKDFNVVTGHWLSRQWVKLKSQLTRGKTYHFASDTVAKDLTHMMQEISEEFAKVPQSTNLPQKDISDVKSPINISKFNQLSRTLERTTKLFSKNVQPVLKEQRLMMEKSHEVALLRVEILEQKQNLDEHTSEGSIIAGKEQAYLNGAGELLLLRNKLNKLMEKMTPEDQVKNKDFMDTNANDDSIAKNISELIVNNRIKESDLNGFINSAFLRDTEPGDTLFKKFNDLRQLFPAVQDFQAMEAQWDSKSNKPRDPQQFVQKGIDFLAKYDELSPAQPTALKDKKALFDTTYCKRMEETVAAMVEDLKTVKTASPKTVAELSQQHEAYLKAMSQLTQIKTIIAASTSDTFKNITAKINEIDNKEVSQEIEEHFKALATSQLDTLLKQVDGEGSYIKEQMVESNQKIAQLESEIQQAQVSLQMPQHVLAEISVGSENPDDLAKQLAKPTSLTLTESQSKVLEVVSNMVDFVRAKSASKKELEAEKKEIDAALTTETPLSRLGVPVSTDTDVFSTLLSKPVTDNVSSLLKELAEQLEILKNGQKDAKGKTTVKSQKTINDEYLVATEAYNQNAKESIDFLDDYVRKYSLTSLPTGKEIMEKMSELSKVEPKRAKTLLEEYPEILRLSEEVQKQKPVVLRKEAAEIQLDVREKKIAELERLCSGLRKLTVAPQASKAGTVATDMKKEAAEKINVEKAKIAELEKLHKVHLVRFAALQEKRTDLDSAGASKIIETLKKVQSEIAQQKP